MLRIAHGTIDFQRLARIPQRARWARCALTLLRAVLVLAPLVCGLLALVHGQPRLAALELGVAALAAGLAWAARPGELCRLAWLLLAPHLARCRHAAAAGRASARVRALARAADYIFCIAIRQSKLIQTWALIIIGNRLLPSVCISPRIISQRPN
ncbi:hypothetical protein [Metallibacterium sp.]|uniref:hypothetical protein n=1 Tax=Metallibacterium sp. TaxID=2940281 RepID=UPI00260DE1ED|nr:hypothetical protein [Metallibacterium sp.]